MEECPRSERCDFIRRDVDFLSFSQGDAADAGERRAGPKKSSDTGNRTRIFVVTGRNTNHYTISDSE